MALHDPLTTSSESFAYDPEVIDIDLGGSEIQKFFSGAAVFVTGGTGFLGKLLIEKLLRSCPSIKTIYMLVRAKKEKSVSTRLKEQFSDALYDTLRKVQPNFISKITEIYGDISHPKLGLSDQDWCTISNEVNVIFHAAATVRFDEPLKKAVQINVRGTREVVTLAWACSNLRALVYVSTAYSNCPSSHIEEKFYKSPISPDALIALVETTDEDRLNAITKGLVGDWPNTYSFTKAVAENIIGSSAKSLPAVVIRPSIVITTYEEPEPGWIDKSNIFGPSAIIAGVGLGLIHCFPLVLKNKIDIVPADLVCNAIIGVAWKTARDHVPQREPPIYNFVATSRNSMTWNYLYNFLLNERMNYCSMKSVWHPFGIIIENHYIYTALLWILHFIPAYIVDIIMKLNGKKPMMVKIFKKATKLGDVLNYFIVKEWSFEDHNIQALLHDLVPADQKIFNCDIASVDWYRGVDKWCYGCRVHLVGDPISTLGEARKRLIKLKYLHYGVCFVFTLILLRIMWAFV